MGFTNAVTTHPIFDHEGYKIYMVSTKSSHSKRVFTEFEVDLGDPTMFSFETLDEAFEAIDKKVADLAYWGPDEYEEEVAA